MFPNRLFAPRMFAPRLFARGIGVIPPPPVVIAPVILSQGMTTVDGKRGGYIVPPGYVKPGQNLPPEFLFPRGNLQTPQDVLEWQTEQVRLQQEEDEEEFLATL